MARMRGGQGNRRWCLPVSIAAALIILIAIVVPLAVILPRKGHSAKKVTILLPLYIYPSSNSTWDDLYTALDDNPDQKFMVIINPSSGPGSSDLPNTDYQTALQKLSNYSAVTPVGYVRTGYATRDISDVLADVSTYSGWASESSDFAMHGIFFDEAPYNYSASAVEYMQKINKAVKNANGIASSKTIIHNPGTIPDSRYNDTNTDITVVFEDSYSAYSTKLASLEALTSDRSAYSYMINSIPSSLDNKKGNLKKFVDGLSKRAEYLFVTDNTEDYYESFGDNFEEFVDVTPH